MTTEEARQTVVLAGRKLLESGLVTRTWGNVSCRISDTSFVITPSGRDYLSLKPEELVEVSLFDLSYSGNIRPSSETGVHAEVYRRHPEIKFVIHTHQDYASAASVLDLDSIPVPGDYPALGSEVACAAYGSPGTRKLGRNVAEALARTKGKAVIMKNHGALCFGRSCDETFRTAQELEKACREYIESHYLKVSGRHTTDPFQMAEFALSQLSGKPVRVRNSAWSSRLESVRAERGFMLKAGDESFDIAQDKSFNSEAFSPDLLKVIKIHNEIYKKHKNINSIVHANTPFIASVSCAGLILRPLLDDFAQIAGTAVMTAGTDPEEISSALNKASAVFVRNNGAICCGPTRNDATAAAIVVEKNCLAFICAALFGRVRYINPLECMRLRSGYLNKYSKQAYKTDEQG